MLYFYFRAKKTHVIFPRGMLGCFRPSSASPKRFLPLAFSHPALSDYHLSPCRCEWKRCLSRINGGGCKKKRNKNKNKNKNWHCHFLDENRSPIENPPLRDRTLLHLLLLRLIVFFAFLLPPSTASDPAWATLTGSWHHAVFPFREKYLPAIPSPFRFIASGLCLHRSARIRGDAAMTMTRLAVASLQTIFFHNFFYNAQK